MTNHLKKKNNVCTILGNGISRTELVNQNFPRPVYACNAYYRDGNPDFLVAIDEKILNEIRNSSFPKSKLLDVPWEEQFEPFEWNPNQPRENAGMIAMRKAIEAGYSHLICYGFDFLLDDKETNLSNVYEGTESYGDETKTSYHDSMRRVDYFNWFVRKYDHVIFEFVYPSLKKPFTFRAKEAKNIVLTFEQE